MHDLRPGPVRVWSEEEQLRRQAIKEALARSDYQFAIRWGRVADYDLLSRAQSRNETRRIAERVCPGDTCRLGFDACRFPACPPEPTQT